MVGISDNVFRDCKLLNSVLAPGCRDFGATPQEAIEYLKKRIQTEPSYHLVSFAREVFAASRYAMHHPPSWCPSGPERTGRGAPFHYFEVLEQQVTWAAYSFLQPRVGFVSAIWLHDGFWVAPRPENDSLDGPQYPSLPDLWL